MKPIATPFPPVSMGDIHVYDDIIQYFNFKQVKQALPHRPKSITFVTTGIIPYDGGQTTMLHLGTELSKLGFQVYYLSYFSQPRKAMEINAEFNYAGYQGTCLDVSALKTHQSDIWIGTLWESVYVFKDKPGYKMYFVQDYEPYFYPFGDRYYLAKKTYELGLHMVSLGPWCAEMIEKECRVQSPLDVIRFPVDMEQYPFHPRNFLDYKKKRNSELQSIQNGTVHEEHQSLFRSFSIIFLSFAKNTDISWILSISVPINPRNLSTVRILAS